MAKLALVLLWACALLAQTRPKFDHCGLGSHKACNCIEHTHNERSRILSACLKESGKDDKRQAECFRRTPQHCELADRYSDTDQSTGEVNPIAMSDRCTMACKKSDCSCDDGPTCHFLHSEKDHNTR